LLTVAWHLFNISKRKEIEMLERVLDIWFTRYGTILEVLEIVCCMTGFRRRLLVEHMVDGSCRSVELGPG
jgi:hypothetical protein